MKTVNDQFPLVNSHNEWDPLEEVIVGRVEGAYSDKFHIAVEATLSREAKDSLNKTIGRHYPSEETDATNKELDEFIHILEAEGVIVKRPEISDFSEEFGPPDWRSRGWCSACPRDSILIVGDRIIEVPMSWRSRYFEVFPMRSLLMNYFDQGAKWISAPKPQLRDSLYNYRYQPPTNGKPRSYVINETEILFDAADFMRCGKDLFVAKSHTTNEKGIEWLERYLGDTYTIHRINSLCRSPIHIDTTFVPLAPGKALINPEYFDQTKIPSALKSWDLLVAPEPDIPVGTHDYIFCSYWLSINVLMLDEKRVFVEKSQKSLAKKLKDWGFTPIFCSFTRLANYGGSFHCATVDIRRRGPLQSYFD